MKKWIKTGFKQIIAVVKTDSTSLCTEGVESVLTTQRNGFGFNNNSCKKLNNKARSGTNGFRDTLWNMISKDNLSTSVIFLCK